MVRCCRIDVRSLSTNGQQIFYTPAAGFNGTETFTYTVNDGTSGSNDTATVTITVDPISQPADVINFSEAGVKSYGGRQDFNGTAVIEDGGATLRLTGNTWKQIDLPYTITANTMLEFDFSSTAQGEIHGIGFDTNNSITASRTFQVYGTQNWGLRNFDNYAASAPGTVHYTIPVGQFYTGQVINLFFTNDHDVSNPNAESVFSNVRVYEAGAIQAVAAPTANHDFFGAVGFGQQGRIATPAQSQSTSPVALTTLTVPTFYSSSGVDTAYLAQWLQNVQANSDCGTASQRASAPVRSNDAEKITDGTIATDRFFASLGRSQ